MTKMRFKLKVGVFLVLIENNQILLMRRYNTGIGDGFHVVPMGSLEENETALQAVIREAKEEVNIDLFTEDLQLAHVLHRFHSRPHEENFPQVDLFFSAKNYKGTISNQEPHKCDEVSFYPINCLPKTTEPFIKQAIECIQRNQFYSEIGWTKDPLLNRSIEDPCPTIYQITAKNYDHGRSADPVITKKLLQHLESKQDGKYLDIGCGSGNYTIALSKNNVKIQGVDISYDMLQQAQQKAPNLIWTHGDMRKLPFDSTSFDGALTINTLHYVRSYLKETFQEIRRILKPGAKLVIFAISLEQCLQFWLGHYFPFFREFGHKALTQRESLITAITEAGFFNVEVDPFFVTEETKDLFTYSCKYRPHLFLDSKIRSGMTPLQLPEYAKEIQIGCDLLQKDILSGAIYKVISQHESDIGEGLVISAKNPL